MNGAAEKPVIGIFGAFDTGELGGRVENPTGQVCADTLGHRGQVDRRTHRVTVSIKALEVAEEKEAIAQYGSSDSGATLGDILGTALKRKGEESEEGDKEDSEKEESEE